ncbi:Hypothetical protein PBC10988_25750 [Planctomycetales bacterium 10988]|nr:Hypothetical protein PBC10988_25750 [Planctomycetales bacterium 10988]
MSVSEVYANPEVQEVISLHEDLFTDEFRRLSVCEQLERQAQRIVEAHMAGNSAVATHVTCWHPELVGYSVDDIMSRELTLNDARETIAREYGFDDWANAEAQGSEPPNPEFEETVDAILAGDVASLQTVLEQRPSLVHERSSFGHRSTLLHYVGCNGVETYRQVVPLKLAQVAQTLLDAGADVNATAEMYGGNCTTIALLITSAFPAEAGVADEVVKVLVNAGAVTDGS